MTESPTPRLSLADQERLAQLSADERDLVLWAIATYPSQAIGGLVLSLYAATSSPAASSLAAASSAISATASSAERASRSTVNRGHPLACRPSTIANVSGSAVRDRDHTQCTPATTHTRSWPAATRLPEARRVRDGPQTRSAALQPGDGLQF